MADTPKSVSGKLSNILLHLTSPADVTTMRDCIKRIDAFTAAVRNERLVRSRYTAGTATLDQLNAAVNAETLALNDMG